MFNKLKNAQKEESNLKKLHEKTVQLENIFSDISNKVKTNVDLLLKEDQEKSFQIEILEQERDVITSLIKKNSKIAEKINSFLND